tara:strand:+ start:62 stop:334 length:273 start_codon:yes stop_codon:yes gene_type:complete
MEDDQPSGVTAEELWDACEEARMTCPQVLYPVSDCEREFGSSLTYAQMRASKHETKAYWLSQNTIGGNTLWNSGYWQELPLNMLKELKKE